jgi:hypothetical protein
MREIKFRAWDGEKFVEDEFYVMDGKAYTFGDDGGCDDSECCGGTGHFMQDKKWVLMQFTGLLDAKGVEIYEGDIWLAEYNDLGSCIVEFSQGKFNISRFAWTQGKVIGNIYANPELVKR